ncbi:MAG: hypothetical protein U9P79_06035 [Candidatus Cloacimonadota bacterium]|nr:hypothetical protein [Candidatus Cloacimonadota bacterium]
MKAIIITGVSRVWVKLVRDEKNRDVIPESIQLIAGLAGVVSHPAE